MTKKVYGVGVEHGEVLRSVDSFQHRVDVEFIRQSK